MTISKTLNQQQLKAICDVLADTSRGLTKTELSILLQQSQIQLVEDGHSSNGYTYTMGLNKRDWLHNCFANEINAHPSFDRIYMFIQGALNPVVFVDPSGKAMDYDQYLPLTATERDQIEAAGMRWNDAKTDAERRRAQADANAIRSKYVNLTEINGNFYIDYSKEIDAMFNQNFRTAVNMRYVIATMPMDNPLEVVQTLAWFHQQVQAGGPMDFKNQASWESALSGTYYLGEDSIQFLVNGVLMTSADLGNINFGYVGALMGIGTDVLLLEAGVAQLQKDYGYDLARAHFEALSCGETKWYGDQPDDYQNILIGIGMAQRKMAG